MLRLTGAIVLAVSLTACAGSRSDPSTARFNLNGQLLANQTVASAQTNGHCAPVDSAVHRGAQVVVTDEDGTTLGVARLAAGSADGHLHCLFSFTVPGVESAHRSYTVKAPGAVGRFSLPQALHVVTLRA